VRAIDPVGGVPTGHAPAVRPVEGVGSRATLGLGVPWRRGSVNGDLGVVMRRSAVLVLVSLALGVAWLVPSGASAATYSQCPPVDLDTTGCQFLIVVTNGEKVVEPESGQGSYDSGADDALIGVQNNSSSPISSLPLSAEDELFGFDGDGICDDAAPFPAGCVVVEKSLSGEANINHGEACPPATSDCGFPTPAGEPAGVTFPENIEAVGEGKNGDPVTGYEGPTSWFTGIKAFGSSATGSGVVNFSPAIPPGGSSYFALEEPPVSGFGSATTLTTAQSGGGQSGASITVVQGTPVTDSATLGGAGAGTATGTVTFNLYSDSECKNLVASAGSAKLASAGAGPSTAESPAPGTYYWQAHYGGNLENQPVTSTCGSEVLTVQAPTTTATIQTGGGVSGASIPVLKGTSVTDQAHIAGAEAASATGTVTYTLYKEASCKTALASSVGSVTGAVAAASAPVTMPVGTYYWVASYSGGGLNAPSSSACGSEKLIVSTKANLGLPSGKKCFSKRAFAIHPRFPKGAKITSYEEFINGTLAKQGKLNKNATSVDLIGLPKGAYKVELLTFAADGASYEDTRTFHTCVPKKHKRH